MTTEWSVEYAPTGRAKCKKSKELIAKGEIRFGKTTQMPEDPEKTMTSYFKSLPFFQMLAALPVGRRLAAQHHIHQDGRHPAHHLQLRLVAEAAKVELEEKVKGGERRTY